jgi:hypothetical protein
VSLAIGLKIGGEAAGSRENHADAGGGDRGAGVILDDVALRVAPRTYGEHKAKTSRSLDKVRTSGAISIIDAAGEGVVYASCIFEWV